MFDYFTSDMQADAQSRYIEFPVSFDYKFKKVNALVCRSRSVHGSWCLDLDMDFLLSPRAVTTEEQRAKAIAVAALYTCP